MDEPCSALDPIATLKIEHVGHRLARVDRGIDDSKMSFQRITTMGSMPATNRTRAVALEAVALVLQAVDLHEVGGELGAIAQAAQRGGDLLAGADEDFGELRGPAPSAPRRRTGPSWAPAFSASRRCRRGRSPARDVGGVEGGRGRRPPGEAVVDVVGDPVAFLFAQDDVGRDRRRARGSPPAGRAAASTPFGRCGRPPRSSIEDLDVRGRRGATAPSARP